MTNLDIYNPSKVRGIVEKMEARIDFLEREIDNLRDIISAVIHERDAAISGCEAALGWIDPSTDPDGEKWLAATKSPNYTTAIVVDFLKESLAKAGKQ